MVSMTTTILASGTVRQRSTNPLLSCMLAPGERPGLFINEGRGATLTLDDGRQVIDCGSISAALARASASGPCRGDPASFLGALRQRWHRLPRARAGGLRLA